MGRFLYFGLALLALPATPGSVAGEPMEVLFIGNSHTIYFDTPGLFVSLAEAAGHEVHVDQAVGGGLNLASQAINPNTLAKIAERSWDHVLLQEHSLYPVIEFYREGSFYPAARTLDSLIADSGSGTSFFMTWGHEFGGQHCIGGECSPDYPDYHAMQLGVGAAYETITSELDAFLVPVGYIWTLALLEDPDAPLWHTDHYHPGPEGAYLNACTFFAAFFGESPEGLEFYGGLDPERAQFYQEIAARVITALPGVEPLTPATPRLLPAYPNPFNPRTKLAFELPCESTVVLEILAPDGRRVDLLSPGVLPAGRHHVTWDAGDAPSGIYLCRLRGAGRGDARKLVLLR